MRMSWPILGQVPDMTTNVDLSVDKGVFWFVISHKSGMCVLHNKARVYVF